MTILIWGSSAWENGKQAVWWHCCSIRAYTFTKTSNMYVIMCHASNHQLNHTQPLRTGWTVNCNSTCCDSCMLCRVTKTCPTRHTFLYLMYFYGDK
jgi:hypothetical protein